MPEETIGRLFVNGVFTGLLSIIAALLGQLPYAAGFLIVSFALFIFFLIAIVIDMYS